MPTTCGPKISWNEVPSRGSKEGVAPLVTCATCEVNGCPVPKGPPPFEGNEGGFFIAGNEEEFPPGGRVEKDVDTFFNQNCIPELPPPIDHPAGVPGPQKGQLGGDN